MTFWNLQIDKAIKISCLAHKEQTRKGSEIPYISHPVAVGLLLKQVGASDEQIISGILHDTIEDTNLTFEDLTRDFGEKIANLVLACTEQNTELNWLKRKKCFLKILKNASLEVKLIVCADKFHNLLSMKQDLKQFGAENLWSRFTKGKKYQAWYYKKISQILLQNLNRNNCNLLFLEFEKEVLEFF